MDATSGNDVIELADEIMQELWRDRRLDLEHTEIRFTAGDEQLRLEGRVPDLAAKRIIANTARQVAGSAVAIEDRLRLQTAAVSDEEIARKLAAYLGGEPVFRECSIVIHIGTESRIVQQRDPGGYSAHIHIDDGVVTLTGEVGSQTHRRLAEVLCWWLPGCTRVDNELAVRPYEDDTDNLLTDAIRIVLEKDPFVDASQLSAATAAGIVELRGLLPTEDAHRLALRDVWAIPGVWDIYDRTYTGQPA